MMVPYWLGIILLNLLYVVSYDFAALHFIFQLQPEQQPKTHGMDLEQKFSSLSEFIRSII